MRKVLAREVLEYLPSPSKISFNATKASKNLFVISKSVPISSAKSFAVFGFSSKVKIS